MRFFKGFFKFVINSLFFSAVFSLSVQVFAEELSKVDSEALQKTVDLMNNRSQRNEMIENNPGAKKADDMTRKLFGDGAELDAAYKAAAQIFRKLAAENNGDIQKMMEQINNGQKNPEAFYKNLGPQERQLIKNLSKGVEDRTKNSNP